MKLKSAVLLSSALISSAAFAQEPAVVAPADSSATSPAAAPAAAAATPAAPVGAPVNKTIVPYGLLQAYVNLYETDSGSAPDFFQHITRFGLKVSEGVAKAQFELGMSGNNAPKGEEKPNFEGVTIRRADVGLDLPSKTSVRFGRYRLGNPEAWGMDATNSVLGFGGSDGVLLTQGVDISEGNSITIKAGVANALSVPASTNYAIGNGGESHGGALSSPTWNTNSKAILAALDVKISGVSAGFYIGTDGKRRASAATAAIVAGVGPDGAAGTADDILTSKAAVPELYRATTHIEGSLGYNIDGIGGGVAYQQITEGDSKSYTNENGKLKDAATVVKGKDTSTLFSVAFNGDSSLFGLTGIAQTGDKLTYGASYGLATVRNSEAKDDAKKALEDADLTQFVVGAGYNAGGFTLELDVAMAQTKGKTFEDKKGVAAKSKAHTQSYLTGIYAF